MLTEVTDENAVKLTQYSHGAGCGCKISPKILDTILKSGIEKFMDKKLLVGNDTRDDAAVYDIGNGQAIISTTDFFMPIVDDAFDFGKIASANAISDIYAMGGKPLMAIAILGWPINKIPAEVAQKVLEGSREICREAGISLAGGHSIDSPEPIFGLAVTGIIQTKFLKENSTATAGCELFLTKPLGVGILSTAQKKGVVSVADFEVARQSMMKLNKVGEELAALSYVKSLTDVTGFGLLGHLAEMCEGSGLKAVIEFNKVPRFDAIDKYIDQRSIPGGTTRNWESYGSKISEISDYQRVILCDPQTSGGLLIAVEAGHSDEFIAFMKERNFLLESFGRLNDKGEQLITVN